MKSTSSALNSVTLAQRTWPSRWFRMMTSRAPSAAAASLSSAARVRASAASRPVRSALSSPCVAHMMTTRAPESTRRASVPPQASDSSSGCAKTASTTCPSKACAAVATSACAPLIDDAPEGVDVPVDHRHDAKAPDRFCADVSAIQGQHPREAVHHRVDVAEYAAGHSIVHELADGAAIERCDGRAARHCFRENEPERLAGLHRVEQRARAAEQFHLRIEVDFTDIYDLFIVDERLHGVVIILLFRCGEQQAHAGALRHLDCLHRPLARREAPEKQQVI